MPGLLGSGVTTGGSTRPTARIEVRICRYFELIFTSGRSGFIGRMASMASRTVRCSKPQATPVSRAGSALTASCLRGGRLEPWAWCRAVRPAAG